MAPTVSGAPWDVNSSNLFESALDLGAILGSWDGLACLGRSQAGLARPQDDRGLLPTCPRWPRTAPGCPKTAAEGALLRSGRSLTFKNQSWTACGQPRTLQDGPPGQPWTHRTAQDAPRRRIHNIDLGCLLVAAHWICYIHKTIKHVIK